MNKKLTKNQKVAIIISLLVIGTVTFISYRTSPIVTEVEQTFIKGVPAGTLDTKIALDFERKILEENYQNAEELKITDILVGQGKEATAGNTVLVNYTGVLANGFKFDSTLDRSEPFEFVLGEGFVIPGWEAGILGMKEGGLRQLVIPPELGYGEREIGPIPPNSVLIFLVELLEVKN